MVFVVFVVAVVVVVVDEEFSLELEEVSYLFLVVEVCYLLKVEYYLFLVK